MGALPVLYSFRRCPYAMRARLALASSGVALEHREILLRDKPAELLAASPKGTVPVLVLPDGQVLEQSLDIMHWALRQHDPHAWLAPDSATMAALITANDGPFKHSLDRYKYPNRYAAEHGGPEAGFAATHRELAAGQLRVLNDRLQHTPWLCGARASLADMAVLPFVRQFAHTDPAWFAAQAWPALQRWLAHFEASALYASVMHKHPPWRASP